MPKVLEPVAGGPEAKLSRSEQRALRVLVDAAVPLYALQMLAKDARLSRGLIHLDMERLHRRGLVDAKRIQKRSGVRWAFQATDAGREWVKLHSEKEQASA